jgi:hypothetical protein
MYAVSQFIRGALTDRLFLRLTPRTKQQPDSHLMDAAIDAAGRRSLLSPLFLAFLLCSPHPAYAVCTEGTIMYNATSHVPQYCDNANVWNAMGSSAGAGGAGCSGGGVEGQLMYNKNYQMLQYCDGTNWRATSENASSVVATTSGLVGWWKFDDASSGTSTMAVDSSGNGNNCTTAGSPLPVWTASGKIGNALTLNGNGDYVYGGPFASLNDLTATTVAGWVYLTALPSVEADLADKGTGATGWSFSIMPDGSILYYEQYGTTFEGLESTQVLSLNAWHHIAETWSGGTIHTAIHLYIDGVETTYALFQDGSGTHTTDAAQGLAMGGCCANTNITGSIDDVRVYNRALSAAEVLSLYQATGGGSGSPIIGGTGSGGTYIQSKSAATAPGATYYANVAVTLTSTVTSGNALAGFVTWGNDIPGDLTSVTDDKGNTYTIAQNVNSGGAGESLASFYCLNITNAPKTITANFASSEAWMSMSVHEVSGLTALDQSVGQAQYGPGTTANAVTSSSVTTASGGEYIIAATTDFNTSVRAAPEFAAGTGFTKRQETTVTTAQRLATEDMGNQGSAGSVAGTFTPTFSDNFITSVMAFATTGSGGSCADASLVGWWKFDEGSTATTADSSGNGNTGTLGGSPLPAWTASGKLSNALVFNATLNTDYVDVPDAAAFTLSTGFTASAWVYATADPTDIEDIVGQFYFADAGGSGWGLFLNSGMLPSIATANAAQSLLSSGTSLSLNTWYHLAVVYTGGTTGTNGLIYINGVLDTSGTLNQVPQDSAYTVRIGAAPLALDNGFQGRIDDVRVYNRALSATEIKTLYNGGSGTNSGGAPEGTLMYNGTYHVPQFCNGTGWQAAKG